MLGIGVTQVSDFATGSGFSAARLALTAAQEERQAADGGLEREVAEALIAATVDQLGTEYRTLVQQLSQSDDASPPSPTSRPMSITGGVAHLLATARAITPLLPRREGMHVAQASRPIRPPPSGSSTKAAAIHREGQEVVGSTRAAVQANSADALEQLVGVGYHALGEALPTLAVRVTQGGDSSGAPCLDGPMLRRMALGGAARLVEGAGAEDDRALLDLVSVARKRSATLAAAVLHLIAQRIPDWVDAALCHGGRAAAEAREILAHVALVAAMEGGGPGTRLEPDAPVIGAVGNQARRLANTLLNCIGASGNVGLCGGFRSFAALLPPTEAAPLPQIPHTDAMRMVTGDPAALQPWPEQQAVMSHQGDAVVVLPTGGGKSLCYQLPALQTGELTVVVCPLSALAEQQACSIQTHL